MKNLGLILLAVLFTTTVFAEPGPERQHPRVLELQDRLTSYARDYLKTRLPEVPFLITLRLEPLRRTPDSGYKVENEQLPFYNIAEEEIRDEWDDPTASLWSLQSRIQKATVVISLPQSLKEAEVDEIKEAVTGLLRLVPGRDEVRIERRSWSLGDKFWNYFAAGAFMLIMLLAGMWVVGVNWTKRVSSAILQIKPNATEKSETSVPASLPNFGTNTKRKSDSMKFSDPIRTREFILSRVNELVKNPYFPNLEALLLMDKVALDSPGSFGALVLEFPKSKQEEIFSLSFKPYWLEAFSEPGELGTDSLELMDRLSRVHYDESAAELEKLMIQVWRLDSEASAFCKETDRDDAFAILKKMPSSISIPVARAAYPGAWGVLLDTDFTPKALTQKKITDLYEKALARKPHLKFEALHRYRRDRDLLDFLTTAAVLEERDLYESLPQDSHLWSARPPFYKIFDASETELKALVERMSLDEWSLSLLNVPRDMRKPFEAVLTEKQRFMVASKMASFDRAGVSKAMVGESREKIGKLYSEIKSISRIAPKEDSNDVQKAA